ncbi:MAG: YceI family protein [Acidobacteriota bacterium]
MLKIRRPRLFRGSLARMALAIATVLPAFAAAQGATDPPAEQLVLFTQPAAGSAVARGLADGPMGAIRGVADELGLPLRVVDVGEEGAPGEVGLTPLLLHQSARGRSFFQGRYVDAGKVAHFVRTSRAIPPATEPYRRSGVAVARTGRAQVAAPLKITALAGDLPAGHDAEAFAALGRSAAHDALRRFTVKPSVELGPSDRSFYFDLYPYRADDGGFYVSVALFSQFNCIDPIFENFDTPVSGTWDDAPAVFGRAAQLLEAKTFELIATSTLGDGFDPVPASVRAVSWDGLGLTLPKAAPGVDPAAADLELGRRWRIAPGGDGGPRLTFRFPSPLERYSGEVTALAGALELGEGLSLEGAQGFIEADTSSVTMGEPGLDNAIHGKMIKVAAFPTSRFELESVAAGAEPVAFGRLSQLSATGTFSLVGREIPVDVVAQIEPLVAEDGAPRLRVRASFRIRLEDPFGILGPDGPAPANDTLQFNLDFLMVSR